MARRDPNWAQVGNLLPIATLSDAYTGPVILAHVDDDRTVRWFAAKANKEAVEHVAHKRELMEGADGAEVMGFMHDEDGKPVTETSTLKPTHWAMAEITK